MKKWLAALLCAALLLTGVQSARAITVEDVYFTAVNISLLPLEMNTMPIWVDGQIYVPASVFDRAKTGADLGVYLSRVGAKNTVILMAQRLTMVFHLAEGTCVDQYDVPIPDCKAVVRKGVAFLPLSRVCDYFGLKDTYTYTRYGYLVRIRTENAPLSDEQLVEMAGTLMQTRMKAFVQANTPVVPDKPDVPDVPQLPPDPPVEPEPPANRVRLYLAVRCEEGTGLNSILTVLNRHRVRAVLLVTPEQLSAPDDLVRRAMCEGHTLGLLAQEDAVETLARGNQLMGHIARTAATVALVPEGQQKALEEQGWICWQQTVDGRPRQSERSAAYVQRMQQTIGTRSRSVYLTLDDSDRTAALLDSLLDRFEEQEYTLATPLESRL